MRGVCVSVCVCVCLHMWKHSHNKENVINDFSLEPFSFYLSFSFSYHFVSFERWASSSKSQILYSLHISFSFFHSFSFIHSFSFSFSFARCTSNWMTRFILLKFLLIDRISCLCIMKRDVAHIHRHGIHARSRYAHTHIVTHSNASSPVPHDVLPLVSSSSIKLQKVNRLDR